MGPVNARSHLESNSSAELGIQSEFRALRNMPSSNKKKSAATAKRKVRSSEVSMNGGDNLCTSVSSPIARNLITPVVGDATPTAPPFEFSSKTVEPDGEENDLQPGNSKAMLDAKAGERLVVVEFKYKYKSKPFITDGFQCDFKNICTIFTGKSKHTSFDWSGTKSCVMAECFGHAYKDLPASGKPRSSALPLVVNSSRHFYKDITVHDGHVTEAATALKQCDMDAMKQSYNPFTKEFQAYSQSIIAAKIRGGKYFPPLFHGEDLNKQNVGHPPSTYGAPATVVPSMPALAISTAYMDSLKKPSGSAGKIDESSVASIFCVEGVEGFTNAYCVDADSKYDNIQFGATIKELVEKVPPGDRCHYDKLALQCSKGMNASRGGALERNGTYFNGHQQHHGPASGYSIGLRFRSGF